MDGFQIFGYIFIGVFIGVWINEAFHHIIDDILYKSLQGDLKIVDSLRSLYNLQDFEVDAINDLVDTFKDDNG